VTPTPEAVRAATDTYAFWLALVATPAVGNLLAALAALVSAAAAYLVWRTRRDVKGTEARLTHRVDHLAATRHPPRPPPEAP
jgi:membrane protein implicated in regulation of membrane protease activity